MTYINQVGIGSQVYTAEIEISLLAILTVVILAGLIWWKDITSRKQLEAALRQSEERFQAFMNNTPLLAFMKDEEGRYLYVNEPLERLFNIKKADLQWTCKCRRWTDWKRHVVSASSGQHNRDLGLLP